ncbi:putative N-acetyltransferase camello [Glandiceps talaboti]
MSRQEKKIFKTNVGDIIIRSFVSEDEDAVQELFWTGNIGHTFNLYKRQFKWASVWVSLLVGMLASWRMWPSFYTSLVTTSTIMFIVYLLCFAFLRVFCIYRLRNDLKDISKYYMSKPRHHCWVAEHNGTVVGSICVREDRSDPQKAELLTMGVMYGYRRSGIGNKLVDTVVEFSRKNDFTEVWLVTLIVYYAARKLYERKGFKVTRVKELPFVCFNTEAYVYSTPLKQC